MWSWPNLISLDAVVVGLLWQTVFTLAYCDRLPQSVEHAMIGLTIWIAYTADRLLDSVRIQLSRPHSWRHYFHVRWRAPLATGWIIAVAVDASLVMTYATDAQLRWGYGAIAVLLGYLGGVHFVDVFQRWVPKELQAGMVFATGTSLVAWSDAVAEPAYLLAGMILAGLLFAANCFSIAWSEQNLDASQGFPSWIMSHPASPSWLPHALVAHCIVTLLLFWIQWLPGLIAACLVGGTVLMLVMVLVRGQRNRGRVIRRTPMTVVSPFGVCVDAALAFPPAVWLLTGTVL